MKGIKHIFFDLDRTLWDFETNARSALTDIFHKYNLGKSFSGPEEFFEIYNHHNERLWEGYRKGQHSKEILRSKRFELTLAEKKIRNRDLAINAGEDYLRICPQKTILFEGATEVLEYLRPNYNLHILTNGFKSTQESKLKNCGLDPYFMTLFTSETIGFHKPNAGIFRFAVNSLNARKTECVMIGDDPAVDIAGASGYGLQTILFDPVERYADTRADFTIKTLLDLKEIL